MPDPEPNPSVPIIVDALTLARSGSVRGYSFKDRLFARLSGLLVSDQPELDVSLQFDLQQGKPVIRGELRGAVEVICQRCMQSMEQVLNEQIALKICAQRELSVVVDDEVDVEEALSEMDGQAEEWVADATRIDVVELVEEQVILALPLVPKHEDEAVCAANLKAAAGKLGQKMLDTRIVVETEAEGMKRPFANLRDLLNK